VSGRVPTFFLVERFFVAHRDVVRRIWQDLDPHIEEQGYELVEVEFGQEGRSPVLRLFIDRIASDTSHGGITLEDCRAVSQLVNPLLDAADSIPGSYTLEVSSPGLDRPVRKPKDFARFAGERVKVAVHAPVAGRKRFTGMLKGLQDGLVTIECDGTCHEVHIENIKTAKLDQ